jgi:choline dehydrogenase-like flavoprotein
MADVNKLPALCSLEEFLKYDYDFIVVGGGTAGLVVAARLTENPNVHVGVLEAGPANLGDPMIMMPAMYVKIIGDPKYDWLHKTIPQVTHSRSYI